MQPQFELSPEVRPGAFSQLWHPPEDHKWGPEQKYLSSDQDGNGLQRGHYTSLHAFITFNLPILTDKSLNITLLPRKSENRSKRKQVKGTLLG